MEVGMKKLMVVTRVITLCGLILPVQAQDEVLPQGADRAQIVQNLVAGLTTDNAGLQRSSALMLGQMYAGEASIQLMGAMRYDDAPKVRIAAAWALCRIGDEVGTYLVKQKVRFEEDAIVRAHEAFYYDTYVQRGVFTVVDIRVPSISEIFTPVPVEAL